MTQPNLNSDSEYVTLIFNMNGEVVDIMNTSTIPTPYKNEQTFDIIDDEQWNPIEFKKILMGEEVVFMPQFKIEGICLDNKLFVYTCDYLLKEATFDKFINILAETSKTTQKKFINVIKGWYTRKNTKNIYIEYNLIDDMCDDISLFMRLMNTNTMNTEYKTMKWSNFKQDMKQDILDYKQSPW